MDDTKKQALERAYARFLAEEKAKRERERAEAEAQEKAEPIAEELAPTEASPIELAPSDEAPSDEAPSDEAPTPAEDSADAQAPTEDDAAQPNNKTKTKKPIGELAYWHPRRVYHEVIVAMVLDFGKFLAWIIDVHDSLQVRMDAALYSMGISLAKEYYSLMTRYTMSRRRIATSGLTLILLSCVMLLIFDKCTVYEYAYNGRVLGYVTNQQYVTDVLEVASSQLTKNNNTEITFSTGDNISFNQVSSVSKTVDSSDEVVNKLAYMTDIEIEAYGIYSDGVLVTIVEKESYGKAALNSTLSAQSVPDDGMEVVSSEFLTEMTIKPITVLITSVQSSSKAADQLTNGAELELYHIADIDETLESIAEYYGVEGSDIYDSDTNKVVTELSSGQKVVIKKTIEPLQVEMVEEGTMSEVIEYSTIRKETSSLYVGDTTVSVAGSNGKQTITGTITKVNGEETDRDITSTEVIKEAVDKVILVGTAERPASVATGIFAMPIKSYTLSSKYGYRWGRLHAGIDFAAPTGTPIYAADGGTVTVSGWESGYGYAIVIDHGNGLTTRYGHCSKLLVSVGDKVYKGQEIALVGNTGNSTGSHLHFEIRKNGVATDPGPTLGLY